MRQSLDLVLCNSEDGRTGSRSNDVVYSTLLCTVPSQTRIYCTLHDATVAKLMRTRYSSNAELGLSSYFW